MDVSRYADYGRGDDVGWNGDAGAPRGAEIDAYHVSKFSEDVHFAQRDVINQVLDDDAFRGEFPDIDVVNTIRDDAAIVQSVKTLSDERLRRCSGKGLHVG